MTDLSTCPDLYPAFVEYPSICSLELRFSTSFSSVESAGIRGLDLDGAKILSKCLSISQCLLRLSLPGNNITDETLSCLYPGLLHCFQLVDLDLSNNRIGETGSKLLSSLLRPEYCLMTVDLSRNHIGSVGCSHLAYSLQDALCLEKLDLSVNHISDKGAMDLFSCLSTNMTVVYIGLSCNRLTERCVSFLSSLLRTNKELVHIDISGNSIGDKIQEDQFDELVKSISTQVLDYRACGFTADQQASLKDFMIWIHFFSNLLYQPVFQLRGEYI